MTLFSLSATDTATRLITGAISAGALMLAACGETPAPADSASTGDSPPAAQTEATDAEDGTELQAAAPEFLSGWVRTPAAGRDVTAGYVSLRAGAEDDQLVGASSPIATRVELHTMEDDGEVMRMRQVDAIDLPAGETVSLAPGGDHLMLFGVDTASLDGEVDITLEFASGATSTVRLPLSFTAPEADASPADPHHGGHTGMDHGAADDTAPEDGEE